MNINARIWENSIASLPGEDQQMRQFVHIAREFFIPDDIAPSLYLANVAALLGQRPAETDAHPTHSIDRLLEPQGRPLAFPTWFLAAYPDVALWFRDRNGAERSGMDGELARRAAAKGIATSHFIDDQGFLAHGVLRALLDLFHEQGRTLECLAPAEDLRDENAAAAPDRQQAMTTQQAVDLVAMHVARYERELAVSYPDRFQDVRARLAAAGLLQLGYYVLVDHTIPLTALIRAADDAAADEDPVVTFVERIEVEVFCAEGGEGERTRVVDACRLLRSRNLDMVLLARKEFERQPSLTPATRNFMEKPEFEPLRQAIGILPAGRTV